MKDERDTVAKWLGESIKIARDSIEAVHAIDKWMSALPFELRKSLNRQSPPEIIWKTKKSQVLKVFIDPDMDCAPIVEDPNSKQVEKQTDSALLT